MKNIIAIIVLVLVVFLYLFFSKFTPISVVENDSYAIADNQITENLFNDNVNENKLTVTPIKVYAFDTLYTGQGKLFVGDTKKTSINNTYPLFTNDNLAIINLSEDSILIDSNFNEYPTYPNFTLTSGVLYNKDDKTRADNNDYLFLKLSNNLLLNSKPIDIKTDIKEYTIDMNSIIVFNENFIKFYSFEKEVLEYNMVEDIDLDSKIKMDTYSFTYEELLQKLGVLSIPNEEIPDIKAPEKEEILSYQKPSVNCDKFVANVYSAKSKLSISDPSKSITSPIVFEVKSNGKLFLRKSYIVSGVFEIIGLSPSTKFEIKGSYKYINENNREVEEIFCTQTINTENIDLLSPLTLSFKNGDIYPTKIEILKLKIEDGLGEETIKGVKKGVVLLNNETFKIKSMDLSSFLKGDEITYNSLDNLKSNSTIEYEILLSDSYGNEIKLKNNKGVTRTSKQIPKVTIQEEKSDIVGVTLRATMINDDYASIQNYRYIVYDSKTKIISEGLVKEDGLIELKDLDSNELFSINIYADYDIEDGRGERENQLIGETKFTSVPITSLGYVRLNLKLLKILQENVSIEIGIDKASTNSRLIELLKTFKINVIEKINEEDIVVYSKEINAIDMDEIKLGNSLVEEIYGLKSTSTYYIEIISEISQGGRIYDLETLTNIKSFTTMKRDAEVLIKNSFITENIIDFDVKIIDLDGSILSDYVKLEVRDSDNKRVRIENLNINGDYVRITYDKLSPHSNYTFNYVSLEYNIGNNNSTFLDNHIIESYKVYTEEGINGTVGIDSLIEKQLGKNLFDINNNVRWKSNGVGIDQKNINYNNNEISLTAVNGYQNYSYYLIDYASKVISLSFYAKRTTGLAPIYIANSDGNATTYTLSNVNSEYQKYTYTLTLNANGYVGFNIREVSGANLRTTIIIKNLQIEEGPLVTSYEQFISSDNYDSKMLINLNDSKDEIATNDYYVYIYKENILDDTHHYEMGESNSIVDKIAAYSLDKNAIYKFDLVVKIRDRDYVIDSISYNTQKEIRAIRTISDFFRMHNNGKYIVLNDLNFVNNGSYYSAPFLGEIDFQGHSVTIAAQNGPSYLFHTIQITGIAKNIDLHVYLNNVVARSNYYGFNYVNNGKIENIMITIEEATVQPNIVLGTMSYVNYGTINGFVVNSKVSIYGERFISPTVIHNYGTMKNGYVYGAPVNATFNNLTTNRKRVGAVAAYTGENSIIKNVYSLITINTILEGEFINYNKQYANIVGESNRGLLKNTYSVGDLEAENTTGDPNVGYVSNTVSSANLFFASKKIYNAKYSQKVSSLAIRDTEFQNKVLNEENRFIVGEFIDNGYYPHLEMPDCMPYQDLIPLIDAENADLIDITSSEVIESNENSVKIILNLHNPSKETITNISIKDASVRILSQVDDIGKSKLTILLESPIKYVSKYYVRSITSLGVYGISYTRNYQDNERAIFIDLFRKIYSINDWKRIKLSPSENYELYVDLDFMNATDFLVGNFSGKLNGNNHTIKNIEVTSGNGLFTTLTGEIKNLFVTNYKKTNASTYGGLIYNSSNGAVIDNVHMKDVYINGVNNMGGIIGYAVGTMVNNSSVTNFKNITGEELSDIRIGGLVGLSNSSYYRNSFVKDVNINILDSMSTNGIGGLIGQLEGGSVDNCYATGNIKTNSSLVGGIVGLSSARISNVYSNVNIESEFDYIGGIVGQTTNNNVSNSLVFGSLYSTYSTKYMHRTAGNLAPNLNNYAFDSQLINGYITDSYYGEILLSKESLLLLNTYENLIKLGNYYNYDQISSGYLPKLYNTDGITLLPNQGQIPIPTENFKIISVDTIKRITDAIVLITFENPNNFVITGVEFDYFNIVNTNKLVTQNGVSSIELVVEPSKYLDNYKLNKILYIEDGTNKEYNKSVRLDLQFYKDLGSFEEWQKISSTFPENYRLVSDIDFTGKVNINYNVVIARLDGMDNGYTIKNLLINNNSVTQSLIKKITRSLNNVNFDNITITNNRNSGNYNSIIRLSYADINNINISNFSVTAPRMAYAAPIAISRGYLISNVTLNNINIRGANYTAGFVGSATSESYSNITASNITIVGQQYTGGIIGYKPDGVISTYFNFHATNMNITGTSYVGGMFGVGGADNSDIIDSNVTGTSYVGGISGTTAFRYVRNNTVRNCYVKGSVSNIGGAYGNSSYVYNTFVFNSRIEGTATTTTTVGGILGHSGGYSMYDSGILDSTITSLGDNVGGIAGVQNDKGVYYTFVYNTTVSGRNNVGGVFGKSQRGTISYLNINAFVTATESNAGGIYGYVQNTIPLNGSISIIENYVIIQNGSVTAQTNAGGLIGYTEVVLNSSHFSKSIVATDIYSLMEFGNSSAGVGSNKEYNSLISDLMVYNKVKINDQIITEILNNGLSSINYRSLLELKTQVTYTSKGFSTSRYDFSGLSSNNYPLLKSSSGPVVSNQNLIPLPIEEVFARLMSFRSFGVHELPKVKVYSIDVDKINIEFDKVDEYTTFEIKINDQIISSSTVDKRTYTFKYDFKTPFEVIISDGINIMDKIFNALDLRKDVSVYNDRYYYIKDNIIKTNGDNIPGNFIHIYLNKAIDNNGNILDLTSNEIIENINGLTMEKQTIPLFNFEYNEYVINTYYNYSEIINGDQTIVHESQYLVKNGKLEIIDSSLPSIKDSVIIDSFGGNSYQTVLGENGIIYNIKYPIKVPNDFVNNNIKYMTNNILDNTGFILISYNDGSIYGFDYRTGTKIFSDMSTKDMSLVEYFKEKLSTTSDVISIDSYEKYIKTEDIQEKLEETSIQEVLENKTDDTTKTYISVYSPIKNDFVIYDEEDLFVSEKNIISESDKILSDVKLIAFYMSQSLSSSQNNIDRLSIFVFVLLGIFISLYIYFKIIKALKKQKA